MSVLRPLTFANRVLGVGPGNVATLLVLAASFGVVFLARNALGYLAPFIAQDLDLTNERIGLLAAAFSLTWAISGYVITTITRESTQRALLAGLLFALGLTSVAAGFAGSLLLLVLARLAGGVVSGPVVPLAQFFAAPLGPERHRGLRMGIVQGLGGGLIAAVLAPLLLVPLAESRGWREAFLLVAVIAMACAALLARVLSRGRVEKQSVAYQASNREQGHELSTHSLPANVVVCCLISAAMIGWLILTLTFFPLYLVRVRQLEPAEMGSIMSLMGLGTIVAGFLVPYLSDRLGHRRVLIIFTLVGMLSPLAIMFVHGSPVALTSCVVIGSLAGGTFPLFMAVIPSTSVKRTHLTRSIGIIQGVGEIAGGVCAPFAGGWAADRFGLGTPLWMAIALALLAGASALALTETRIRTIQQ